jgi:molybdenum cofactor cytidylyltransferase
MGTDKALLPWPPPASARQASGGQTFLSAAICALSELTEMVIVVAGRNTPNLEPIVYANAAFLVENPDPSRGQFSSLQVGLQEVLNRGRDAAMVTLVDRPPPPSATLEKLCQAFAAVDHSIWAVVPEYKGKHGHPVMLKREMMDKFLKAPATATAREIEHLNQDHIEYLTVDDPSVTLNIDTPGDYASLSPETVPK